MEALGEKLKKTREAKGMTLDQIARDTHITKRFLEALELEDYAVLPGESYVLGFLRSYAEHLGLNSTEMVNLYRNIKLQEQPAPMDELLVRRGLGTAGKVLIGIAIAAVIGIGIWVLYSTSPEVDVPDEVQVAAVDVPEGTVIFDQRVLERRFVDGTNFMVRLEGGEKTFQVAYRNNQPVFIQDEKEQALGLNQEASLDLDGDGAADIRLAVRSVDTASNPVRLQVYMDRRVEGVTPSTLAPLVADQGIVASLPAAGVHSGIGRARQASALVEGAQRSAMSGTLTLSEPVFIRIQSDGNQIAERFSTRGEVLALSANEVLRLYVSDGAKASLQMGGRTLTLGNPGELAAWQFVWEAAGSAWNLAMQPLF